MARPAEVRVRIKGTSLYLQEPGRLYTSAVAEPSYRGAGTGARLKFWNRGNAGPNAAFVNALETLRARSRDVVRKSPFAGSAVESLVANVVGTGIKPQFTTADPELNKQLGDLFLRWTDQADTEGLMDFYGLQALAVRGAAEGGECFLRLRPRLPRDGLAVPLQIQLLEGEYCPADKMEAAAGRNQVVNGIEFDAVGRRIGYHLYRSHPRDWSGTQLYAADTVRVPAESVIHFYEVLRPGQNRGLPWLSRALVKLYDLDLYDDAEMKRKQLGAFLAGFITTDASDDDDGLLNEGEADSTGAAVATMESGTMLNLAPGEDVKFNDVVDVGSSYEPFMAQQVRAIAASCGVLYEQLSGDYSKINDRTYRAAVNEFRRRCAMLQHHLVVYRLCRPVLAAWVSAAVMSGAVRLPAGMTPADVTAKWVPQGWSYIHPVQEVQAARDAVRAGFKSRAEVVSESGYDVEAIDAEIAADNERADSLGLSFDSDARGAASIAALVPPPPAPEPPVEARAPQQLSLALNIDAKQPTRRMRASRLDDGTTLIEEYPGA